MNSEIIVFDKVSLKISNTKILNNLNFSISQGDFTYLIGKTSDWLDINRINVLHKIAKDFKEAIYYAKIPTKIFFVIILKRKIALYK